MTAASYRLSSFPASTRVRTRPFSAFLFLPLLLTFILAPVCGASLVVRDTRWGFDGRAVPDAFNIFSVELINPGRSAFDGTVRLVQDPFGSKRYTPYEEPCYIAPGGSRWVQFCVLVEPHGNQWILSWGSGATESMTVRHPDMGAPACVLLSNDFGPFVYSGFRRFPDFLIPPSSAAMAGLDAVLLDHVPRWEPVRRKAFLEWLQAGGTVHILQDERGAYPVFGDDLAPLNSTKARLRVGSGTVLHHPAARPSVTPDYLTWANAAPPELSQNPNRYLRVTDTLTKAYTPLLRPQHRWWLIYIVALLYIVAVSPGVFLVGRKVRNYRFALLALVGCIVLATGCMHWAGYRSEKESNAVYTMACARPAGVRSFLVTQWVTAFAGRGGGYRFQHQAPHNFYAPATTQDESAGLIRNGRDGSFLAEMPINSFRSFAYRGVLTGDDLNVTVTAWSPKQGLPSLRITVPSAFPRDTISLWAVHRGRIQQLDRQGDVLSPRSRQSSSDLGQVLNDKVQSVANMYYDHYYSGVARQDRTKLLDDTAERMQYLLMAVALEGTDQTSYRITRAGSGDSRLALFVMARCPPGFSVNSAQFPTQHGYVLYHTTLTLPEAP